MAISSNVTRAAKVKVIAGALSLIMMALVACNNGNKSKDDQSYNEARAAYSSCVANRGADLCNRVKFGNLMSINDFFGQRTFNVYDPYSNNTFNPYGYQQNNMLNTNTRMNPTTIDRGYMEGYLKSLPEDSILEMKRGWEDIAVGRDNQYNQLRNCGYFGC